MQAGGFRDEHTGADRAAWTARFGLDRAQPHLSARRRLHVTQVLTFLVLFVALAVALQAAPGAAQTALRIIAFTAFAGLTIWRLLAAGAALSRLVARAEAKPVWDGDLPVYTILCPLYREANMVKGLAERLAQLDYPADKIDLRIVLESDDTTTIAAANAIQWPPQTKIVIVPACSPRTKPKALNYALASARGAFVTIYDAEDAPDPKQLRAALDAFAGGGEDLGCVQAPLLIDNARASWLSAQFAAEYAIQFSAVLPYLARLGMPLMLGGTSNHFRVAALIGAGGWDPFNVTEDADIGYRLARDGWRFAVIDPPTWEEAPTRLWPWLRQRARWIKGHLQTWLVLMRDPIASARDMGAGAFLSMQIMLGGSLLSAFAHGPIFVLVAWALISPSFNLGPIAWSLALAGYAIAAYNAISVAAALRDPRLAFAALTMPFYWPLSTIAALMAGLDFLFRPHYWAKTQHGISSRISEPS